MTRYGGLGRTRPKKLTSKASIPIVREHEIDLIDDEIQSTLQQIETGVEKAEESEFHLQAAINAAAQGKDKDAHIPTREVIVSDIQYAKLYPPIFSQPATYIRFSSTVEDCCGCPYNMNEEDDAWLRNYNSKRDASSQCSEDDFEATMNFFEETAQAKQPFAAVDSPPVLSFADMAESMDAAVEESVKRFAKDIYEHWKARRLTTENLPLEPMLKFETGQDTDDSDPFVCFRRREVRQIRKTRGRDAQSAEKLRRLRKELEEARQLVALVRQREIARKEMLGMDRTLFTQRNEVKEMKRKLNIKDDDEDLINQKPKKKTIEMPPRQPNAPQLRMPLKPGLQGAEDLQLLEDVQSEKENEILRDIKANIAKHIKWNEGFVDHTRAPLSPSPERTFDAAAFRPAFTAQLPTPPSSQSSSNVLDTSLDVTSPLFSKDKLASRALELHDEPHRMPSFRRRVGRGGRLFIDRRNLVARCKVELDPFKADRFKYDQEDSDEEPTYDTDAYSIQIMQHRAITMAKAREQAAVAAQAHAQAQAQAAQQRRLQADQAGNAPGANPVPNGVTVSSEAS
ncbi:Enhancer of polycomb-like protein 1 [Penicillium subrubescens]|uniref:Enhancer of polycomb-like protein n=1 Tax=Penicillium subrubescens TaxID=1316194 RepID=A0A1Q5TEE9_9EURO|nr:Enhancer of polycomb-like protein 1 [Penicillium subrubescens]KAJ5873449.1 Enhancer of polycomb-like protein 1 [Penicillium subrubescens]OKO98605.1 Enhancer of polycomb-like protein 1 [Penicillium subrubescens]